MTVLDLIIKLQQLDPNKEVLIDATSEHMDMFLFKKFTSVEESEIPDYGSVVVLTNYCDDDEDDEIDFGLN